MIDKKYWLSRDQVDALTKEEAGEFYNAWANYWRYDIGINVLPAAWRIIHKEKKFIPIIPWKEYKDKPIPEKRHLEWLANGSFVTGIAGIFGSVWHRPDKRGYYFGQVDADNTLAIKEIIAWKGDADIAAFAKRTIVEQHEDNLENSMHVGLYSKIPLTNKDADVPKSNKDRPSFEVRCIGRMGIMSPSKHRKGYPMMLVNSYASTEPMTSEDGSFEQYLNSICAKFSLKPYLNSGNGLNDGRNGHQRLEKAEVDEHETGNPLSPEIIDMIKTKDLEAEIEIYDGTRHKTLLKIADSILFRYSESESLTSLKDFFILINEHYCKPSPLQIGERDQIWNDSVDYVSRKKAEQSNRILTVSEAIREKPGNGKIVSGTIVSISTPFKVVYKAVWQCLNCNTKCEENKSVYEGVPFININNMKPPSKCVSCGESNLRFDNETSLFDDAKILSLQNHDVVNEDLDEQLEVMVYGDYTKNIRAGELVTIHGHTHITPSNNGSGSGKKLITVLHSKFVVYEDRRSFDITEKDIEAFRRFVAIKPDTVLERLVSMTAPNVIGWNEAKLGCLRSIVGGVEQNRRGRINSLFVGDKGLAKSLIMREAVKMQPNSRFITAHSASSRSALGIVDVINETKTLIYGPIPLSSGAMVGIDELQTWTFDEQGSVLSVMEEGEFFLLKYGKNRPIQAKTTILATVNPQDIIYNKNRSTIARNEVSILPPLYDRFDQVFVFLDTRDVTEKRRYADQRIDYSEERMAHNYNFIDKYLLYAKRIQPVLTAEAKATLKEFWVTLSESNLAGNRSLDSIFRIAQAMAKLQLKTVIDMDVAKQTMESIKSMEERKHYEYIKIIDDPRDVALKAAIEMVENTQCAISLEAIAEQICKENESVKSWLLGGVSHRLSANSNRRYRELRDRFIQRIGRPGSKIRVVSMTPLVVIWQMAKTSSLSKSDISDISDTKKDSKETKNVGDKGDNNTRVSDNSPNKTIESNSSTQVHRLLNHDADFSDGKDETTSQMSQMSPSPTSSSEDGMPQPNYEYLEEVDAYRCLRCKCIYYFDIKDTISAHPCNRKEKKEWF